MAWIDYVRVPDADPDNILQIHGVQPGVLDAHSRLHVEVMRKPGPVARRQREMIGVVVSSINGCHY